MTTCIFLGCGLAAHGHGLCRTHLSQLARGQPLTARKPKADAARVVLSLRVSRAAKEAALDDPERARAALEKLARGA